MTNWFEKLGGDVKTRTELVKKQILKQSENQTGMSKLFSKIPKTTKTMKMLHTILKIDLHVRPDNVQFECSMSTYGFNARNIIIIIIDMK